MAGWDIIECGFNTADETLNFGTRNFADATGDLYEVCTLASIRTSTPIDSDVCVKALVNSDQIFFTVDGTIKVFTDVLCNELHLSFNFDVNVDTFCVTEDGRFLFICLRSGTVYCYDLQHCNELVFSSAIMDNDTLQDKFFVDSFIKYHNDNVLFLVIINDGRVFRIILKVADELASVVNNCEPETSLLVNFGHCVNSTSFNGSSLLGDGLKLSVYDFNEDDVMSCDDGLSLKQICCYNNNTFIAIDAKGDLIKICSRTLLTSRTCCDVKLDSFVYVMSESCDDDQVLAITRKNEAGLSYIQSFTYPDFVMIFSLKLSSAAILINPQSIYDEYMYVSVLKFENAVEELRFMQVINIAPDNRLRRLLRRQKFDEALLFAKTFNLDKVEVQKGRAQSVVDKVSCSSADVDGLLTILDEIEDVNFKVRCCFEAYKSCEDLEDVRKVLSYGCQCAPKLTMSQDVDNMLQVFSEMLFRYETYRLLPKQEHCNVDWSEFSENDLLDSLILFIRNRYIEGASIIYNRLDFSNGLKLNLPKIEEILELLDDLRFHELTPFLYCFLPVTLSHLPGALVLLVKWLKRKLFVIEQRHRDYFPELAIDFTATYVQALKLEAVADLSLRQQLTFDSNAVEDLANLPKALEKIKFLKDTYHIIVPLKEYLKGPKSLIGTLLQYSFNPDEYEHFLRKFLCDFMAENRFQSDDVFFEELCELVKHEERRWIKMAPSILNCINNSDVKVRAVLVVLENAELPWCQAIRDLAKAALKYKQGDVEAIKNKILMEPIDTILRKPKYNLLKNVNLTEHFKFVIERILYCQENTMVHDVYKLCNNSDQKHWVTMKLIDCYVRSGNYSAALDVFDACPAEEVVACCCSLLILLEAYATCDGLYKIIKNYSTLLKSVQQRWRQHYNGRGHTATEKLFQAIQSYVNVKEKLLEDVKFEDLANPERKRQLFNVLLCDVAQKCLELELNVDTAMSKCKQISTYLNETEGSTVIHFCQKLNNFDLIYKVVKWWCVNEYDPKNLCLLATLLMKSVDCWGEEKGERPGNLSMQENTSDVGVYLLGLKLAQDLATKAILKSNVADISSCVEVFNWATSMFFACEGNAEICNQYWKNFGLHEEAQVSFGTIQSFTYVFNAFTHFIGSYGMPSMKYLTYFDHQVNQLTQEQFVKKIEHLPNTIQNLCIEGHSTTAYMLITSLTNGLRNAHDLDPNVYKLLRSIIIGQCVPQLLKKIFAAPHIDAECAYMLLLDYSPNDFTKVIMTYLPLYKKRVEKLTALAKLALRLLNYHQVTTNKKLYEDIVLLSKWWVRVHNCKLTMKKFFTLPKDELLKRLIEHQHVDLKVLTEFCGDFRLNLQASYNAYLNVKLVKWVPCYEKSEDEFGEVHVVMRHDEDELLEACKEVILVIQDKEALYAFINEFYSTINFYHYEVFVCMFKILPLLKNNVGFKKKLMLLEFLISYRRVRPPGNAETEEWYTAFPDSQHIDPLSQWRLPFTPTLFTVDIWKVVKPEINLKTYAMWCDAAQILDKTLNKNDICCYAVQEVVASGTLSRNDDHPRWALHAVHENLFEEVDACVQNITDLEKAASAVYHLMAQTPKGADQVNAAKLCLKYSRRYKEQSTESDPSVLKAYEKVTCKYLHYSGCHILHRYGLADDKYVEMLSQHKELINALYMDKRILKRTDVLRLNCPDINGATDELGKLFNVDMEERRFRLVDGFLSARVSSFSSDWMSPEISGGSEETNVDKVKRASYVCQSGDLPKWQEHLLKMGLDDDCKSLTLRANALTCLCAISSRSSIESLTHASPEVLLIRSQKLFLLGDLQCLGIVMDVEQLEKRDKHELLRRLSKDRRNGLTIKIMASICMVYALYDLQYWEIIVNSSVKLELHQHLKKYVFFLKDVAAINQRKFFVDAWQAIVDRSFDDVGSKSGDQHDACVENVLVMQSCPVLFSLNVENVFASLCRLGRFEFAAVMLQYLPAEGREERVQEILRRGGGDVALCVGKLASFGIWGVSHAVRLIDAVTNKATTSCG